MDYRALPPTTAARLAAGLRCDSRAKSLEYGLNAPFSVWLMALCADQLASIRWMLSTDGAEGINHPELLAPTLMIGVEQKDSGRFGNGEEFEAWREARMKAM